MTSRSQLAAVFFDFAGTLFDDRDLRAVHLRQLRRLAEHCGLDTEDRALRAAYREGLARAYGQIATDHYYSHRDLFAAAYSATADVLGRSLEAASASQLVDHQYAATVAHAELRPGCRDLLAALRSRGLHLQIVSNMDTDQIDSLVDKFELADVLDEWTCSEEARSCKPHSAIFEMALGKAQCRAQEVLFVGDTIMHDVATPTRLGMRAALLAPGFEDGDDAGGATYVVRALSDVEGLVDPRRRAVSRSGLV